MVIKYELIKESKECKARLGRVTTPHGSYETPVFMAVGTNATVKTMSVEEFGMIPGFGSKIKNMDIDDKQFVYIEAIVSSMTDEERKHPELIAKNPKRRERVSKGSGRSYQEVNNLVQRFDDMRKQMGALAGLSPEEAEKKMKTGQGLPKQKVKKGKGKGRGNFRF